MSDCPLELGTEMTERDRDFSAEQKALRQLIEDWTAPGGTSDNWSSLDRFYDAADREFRKTRHVGIMAVQYPQKQWFSSLQELPTSPIDHIRGYIHDDGFIMISRTKDGDQMDVRKVNAVTFHSQPTKDLDSDIPGDDDLFDFLKFSHLRHIVVERNYISELSKGPDTLRLSLKL